MKSGSPWEAWCGAVRTRAPAFRVRRISVRTERGESEGVRRVLHYVGAGNIGRVRLEFPGLTDISSRVRHASGGQTSRRGATRLQSCSLVLRSRCDRMPW
jgi:hypothetical protein